MKTKILRLVISRPLHLGQLRKSLCGMCAVLGVSSLVNGTALAETLSTSGLAPSWPAECHAISRDVLLTNDQSAGYLSPVKTNKRADILCIGEDLVINTPIYSNGGNILLWANKISINATIDSRVYVNHSSIDYFQPRKDLPGGGYYMGSKEVLNIATDDEGKYVKSYKEYYLDCQDCRAIDGHYWIARAPSGQVPVMESEIDKDGLAPADDSLNFNASTAGNISVLSNEILIGEEVGHGRAVSTVITPDNVAPLPFAVNASGMEGGRGGAGTPSHCVSGGTVGRGFGCADFLKMMSGRTGPGGKGGNGGDITLIKIGSDWSAAETAKLSSAVRNAGGIPGSNKAYKGPSYAGEYAATGSRTDFFRRPNGEYQPAAKGQDGETIIRSMSPAQALNFVGQYVQSNDSRLDYNLTELALRAKINVLLSDLTFDDYLTTKLNDFLATAELAAANSLKNAVISGSMEDAPLGLSLLAKIDARNASQYNLSPRARIFLRQLGEFADNSHGGDLAGYFWNSGGLLDIRDERPQDRFFDEANRIDAAEQTRILNELQVSLNDIGSTLANIDIQFEQSKRLEELQRLQSALIATKDAAEKSQLEWAGDLATKLESAIQTGASVYAAYTSANYLLLIQQSGAFLSALDSVRSAWSNQHATDSGSAELSAQIGRLQQDYANFIAKSAARKQEYGEEKVRALATVLYSRGKLANRQEARHAQFHDLLRLTFVSYVIDPSLNKSSFENNIDSLNAFLTSFPSTAPFFQFRSINFSCVSNSPSGELENGLNKCVRLPPSPNIQVVTTQNLPGIAEIPLYVVAPRPNTIELPTFGLQSRIISGSAITENDDDLADIP